MSRPTPAADDAVAAARAQLTEDDRAGFDRLAHAVRSAPGSAKQPALGAVLRSQLPGNAGVRWLHAEGLSPLSRATDLTTEHWMSLHTAWLHAEQAPKVGGRAGGAGPRADSRHGHAPGAQAAPRWF